MATATYNENDNLESILRGAKLLQAYIECSDKLQVHARKLIATLTDPEVDDDDRQLAAMTLADVLFPNPYEGELGSDLNDCEAQAKASSKEACETLDRMDSEEATFADRLKSLMDQRGMTQIQLAKAIGRGQPAISMMLLRECRPQRATVARLAEALQVAPDELWPGFRQQGK